MNEPIWNGKGIRMKPRGLFLKMRKRSRCSDRRQHLRLRGLLLFFFNYGCTIHLWSARQKKLLWLLQTAEEWMGGKLNGSFGLRCMFVCLVHIFEWIFHCMLVDGQSEHLQSCSVVSVSFAAQTVFPKKFFSSRLIKQLFPVCPPCVFLSLGQFEYFIPLLPEAVIVFSLQFVLKF